MSDPVSRSIGRRLQLARQRLGYTQRDWAKYLGMTAKGYAHYEAGRNRISSEAIGRLAKQFGFAVEEVIYGYQADEEDAVVREIIAQLRVLDRRHYSTVRAFLQALRVVNAADTPTVPGAVTAVGEVREIRPTSIAVRDRATPTGRDRTR